MLGGVSRTDEADEQQLLADLDRATQVFAQLVDNVRPDQLAAPTPCPDVDARTLIEHLIEGSWYFTALLTEVRAADRAPEPEPLPAAFRAASGQMLAAFNVPGRLARDYDPPVGSPSGRSSGTRLAKVRLIELVVHGWDLARATGQHVDAFPANLCEHSLSVAHELYTDRGAGFGSPQPVQETAAAVDKLAAFLGRQV
jgi:uncharacterized protein (TIGR03086 family)